MKRPKADESLESVPGLGIIRIRSLRKAGFDSVDDLRRASADDLAAVPGISADKAQAIVEYAAGKTAPPAERPEAAPEESVPTIEERIQAVAERAGTLLKDARALDFDRSLARQVARIAGLSDHGGRLMNLSDKDGKRAGKQIDRIAETLERIEQADKLGAKRQDKLSDDLRGHRRKLLDMAAPASS